MKRYGNLYNQIISRENLRTALRNACRSNGRSSPAKRKAVTSARANPEAFVDRMEAILTGEYKTSPYACFPLFDPKLRFIYALPFFPDRVAHHALINVLEPLWDGLMFTASYACRKGKGQHLAGNSCAKYTRQYRYVAQFDVAQFYVSINHEILKSLIRRKIKDVKVLTILDEIIDSISTRDKNLEILYGMRDAGSKSPDVAKEIAKLEASKERDCGASAGLPIGSYTSQWFGNLYMNEVDTFLKQDLRCKAVVRYCDDFLVFDDDKHRLAEIKAAVKDFMWNRLHLMLSKAEVFPTSHGVDFCGYRYFTKGYVLLRRRTARSQARDIREIREGFRNGTMPFDEARARLASLDGWMRWAQCHNWKKTHGYYELRNEVLNGTVQ